MLENHNGMLVELVRSWISVREDDSVARRICAGISNSRRNVVRAVDHNRHRHANRPSIQEIFSALYIWIGSMPSDKFVLCFGKRLCRLVLMRDCWPQSFLKQLAEMHFKFVFIGMAYTMKVLSLFGKPSFC